MILGLQPAASAAGSMEHKELAAVCRVGSKLRLVYDNSSASSTSTCAPFDWPEA